MNSQPSFFSQNGKAIIIGAGPSVHEGHLLDLIKKSKFKGLIVTTDRMLKPCLIKGLWPPKFDIIVCHHEYIPPDREKIQIPRFAKFFDGAIIKKYAPMIRCVIACTTNKILRDLIKETGFEMFSIHHFGKLCQWRPEHPEYEIKAAGNTGMFGHQIARVMYHCTDIATIGIEFDAHSKFDDYPIPPTFERERDLSLDLAANDFFSYGLVTKNCSKSGRFYGKGIKDMDLIEFLENDNSG